MSSPCPTDFDMRSAEASTVIVHHVPPQLTSQFAEWQEEITTSAKEMPGYVKTEVYPPAEGNSDEWVIVATFKNQNCLNHWLESPERARCVANARDEIGSFSMEKMPGGFGEWFAGLDRMNHGGVDAPVDQLPGWKMVMVVTLALYPIVMLTSIFINPWLSGLGMAVTILIGNTLSVSLLQWFLMPPLTTAMQRWISTPFVKAPLLNAGGAIGIAAIIGCVAMLFRQFTG